MSNRPPTKPRRRVRQPATPPPSPAAEPTAPRVDWRRVQWATVLLSALYVWVLGLAVAFVGFQTGLAQSREFAPALMLLVALAAFWIANRAALRAGQQPLLHGLLVGLLVGLGGLVLSAATGSVGVPELAAGLLQTLGGLLGGRVAQRMLAGRPSSRT
ncbi:MAG: hypothetical protein NZ528_11635 [Caldilineales bacterium]|nr:hypothetical protein [Caldilineales bacterium]MDW8317014.1 hypothetical protein [Anaerolineae bacterium]